MLTKKYYEMIAKVVRTALPGEDATNYFGKRAAWSTITYGLSDEFERDNHKFDRTRFLKACGVAS